MVRISLIFLIIFFITKDIKAQQPLNLSFEKKSVEVNRPWGWTSSSWSESIFSIDSSTVKHGNYSLKAHFSEQSNPESYSFPMEPLDLRGKKISLNGFVKGANLKKDFNISISYFYNDNVSEDFIEKEAFSTKFSETFDWSSFTVSADIPDTAKMVHVKINMNREGTAWVDNLELFIEGNKYESLRVSKEFTESNMDWFKQNVTAFSSHLASDNFSEKDSKDLLFFKKAVENSQVVALGESTHGTHEFFTLKHKLLQYAVEEMGFRVFAIEDHQLIVRKVDTYIKTGEGSAKKSMSGIFGVWNRQEVLDMIIWLREYNIKHPKDMVSFIGFDIQNVNPSIESLKTFLSVQDSEMLTEIKEPIAQLTENAKTIFFTQDTLEKQKWVDEAILIHNKLIEQEELWLQKAKNEQEKITIHYGLQYANLIVQFFKEGLHNGQMLYRDEAMAENLLWYLKYIQPGSKVIIWAHDVHVSRGEHPITEYNLHSGKSMGSFLAKEYKDRFKSFGISTYSGTYRAYKTYAYKQLIESPLFDSPKGTIEEALHQISLENKEPYLYLPLNNAENWLKTPVPVRFANHVSFDYGFWPRFVVPSQFDGIFFIDKTTSAKLIER